MTERTSPASPTPAAAPATAAGSVPFVKLFAFSDAVDLQLMLWGTVGAVVNGLAIPFMTILFGQAIDAFGQNAGIRDSRVLKEVSKVSVRFLYLGAVAFVGSYLQLALWTMSGERQANRIRRQYLQAILRQDVPFFDKETTTGQFVSRLSGDTILIQDAISDKVGQFIQLLSTFVGGFVVAVSKGWELTLVLLATIPAIAAVAAILSILIIKAASQGQHSHSQAGDVVEQAVGAIRTVAAFSAEGKSTEAYRKKLQGAYRSTLMEGLFYGLGSGAFLLIFFSSYALAIFYGSKLILQKNQSYTGGDVINVLIAVVMGSMSLGQAIPPINAFASGRAAAFKMFQVMERVPDIDVYDMKGDVLDEVKGEIEFRNVGFAYPARPEVRVFYDFSVHIAKGTTAAFVGESGSGKSTVINLIQRFYDPQEGVVCLDGVDIKKLQLKWLRRQMSLVSQEPVLFATSIRENIAYGKEGASVEEIEEAAMLANASTFISQLPAGYETVVGEYGTKLSGGQKQRVAIARAILRNPCVLLLDEATSALDVESEGVVQEALERVMMGRTTVVVAHRLTTIRKAHIIAVLHRGVIVEKGKHEELLHQSSGTYSQLIKLQQTHQDMNSILHQSGENASQCVEDTQRYERSRSPEQVEIGKESFRRSFCRECESNHKNPVIVKDADVTTSALSKKAVTAEWRRLWRWFAGNGGSPGKFKDVDGIWEEDLESGDSEINDVVPHVSIFRLLKLNRPETLIYAVGSVGAIAAGVTFPVYGLLLSSTIKTLFEPPHELRQHASFWAFMFLLLGTAAFFAQCMQKSCFHIGGAKLVARIRCLTFEKVLQQEIGWFDDNRNSSGAVCARLSADAAQVKALVGDTLSILVQNLATVMAAFMIAFSSNWNLASVMIALMPLIGLQGMVRVKLITGFGANPKEKYEVACQIAANAVGSIRTVASFGAEEKLLKLYDEYCKSSELKGVVQSMLNGSVLAVANLIMYFAFSLCFWYGAKLVQQGKTDVEGVFRVFFAISMGSMTIAHSVSMLPDLSKAKAAVNSVFALIERRSRIDPYEASGITPSSVTGIIEFSHVSFRYPTRPNVIVLRDFSLTVEAGKRVALVGESGCGKSTVISLIERFYDPEKGMIYFDGTDIRRLQVRWLRQQMALVSQEPVLFNASIKENILYGVRASVGGGKAATEVVEEEGVMVAAARAANAEGFIGQLPEGYETCVGERGIQLSGGQKQRVAIARAMAKNPRILLLDEATSALDAESERSVQEALEKAMVGRTVVIVAHRLSTIRGADVIAVVKDGVVAEQGHHDVLLRSGAGHYASLMAHAW